VVKLDSYQQDKKRKLCKRRAAIENGVTHSGFERTKKYLYLIKLCRIKQAKIVSKDTLEALNLANCVKDAQRLSRLSDILNQILDSLETYSKGSILIFVVCLTTCLH
jgi:HD superfamily phosphodiesterase